jgi:hypothetical protein
VNVSTAFFSDVNAKQLYRWASACMGNVLPPSSGSKMKTILTQNKHAEHLPMKTSMIYRTPVTYPRDHTSNLMLCLLKTRWQARALRWIVTLKVALYAGLFVSLINEVRSFGGSSCKRHIMIGKTATRLTFLGHIMKAILKVMSIVKL